MRSKWSLLGVPDHQGVANVGGRLGAGGGPAAFRKTFAPMRGRANVQGSGIDHGDVAGLGMDVATNHSLAAEALRRAHEEAPLSVIVGGGHDHGFSQLLGIKQAHPEKRVGCINVDAHLDVRKPESPSKIGSGSPFYLAIEAGLLDPRAFVEFGIQSHCNGPELWNYVEAKGVRVVSWESLRHQKVSEAFHTELSRLISSCDLVVLSLDLDAASSAFAPGVSAPQSEGFTSSDLIELCEIAGGHPHVPSLGIFELNPLHDLDGRTARLGATCAYHFIENGLRR